MIWILFCTFVFAVDLPGEELFSVETTSPVQAESKSSKEDQEPSEAPSIKRKIQPSEPSNLPVAYLRPVARQSTESELVIPPKGAIEIFRGIRVGDIVEVEVPHSVIAFPDEKSPVIALGQTTQLSGIKFVGESYLEKNSKRIFIEFKRLVIGHQIFELKGSGVSRQGQPGLTGEHYSREAEYFTGDFLASFAAGYFDGLVPRRSNAFGQIETDSSVDSAVKKGLASGALSTADRFREKLKRVPEFSEIKGPFSLKILILEQAKTMN